MTRWFVHWKNGTMVPGQRSGFNSVAQAWSWASDKHLNPDEIEVY